MPILATEGHRFFDLVRWGNAETELNAYLAHEVESGFQQFTGASFDPACESYFPIPESAITSYHGTVQQHYYCPTK